jgi:hypothetical protein
MAEEQEESTGKSFKNIIIGLVSTVTLAVGGFITNKLTGGDDKETPAAVAPVINIQNNQTQSAGGKTVIIKEKAADAKPAAPVKKKEGDEFKEKPAQW